MPIPISPPAVFGVQRFPDSVVFAFLAQTFGIAGVIGQDFLGPLAGRQLEHEHDSHSAR